MARKCPVLFIALLKLHCGLSLELLHFWNPYDVYFQIQAFISNHAHKKMGDQCILSNRPVLVQNCMVKCFSRITLLKHDLTLISLQGVCTHPKVSPSWPKNKIMIIFVKLNSGLKIGSKTARQPGLMSPTTFAFLQGFPPL